MNTNLLTPLAFLGMIASLYILLYLSVPEPDMRKQYRPPAKADLMLIINDAWYGELILWQAFWPFFVLLNIVLVVADGLVMNGMFSVSSWDNILLMAASSSCIWFVAVWRCSINTGSRIWAAFARLLTFCVCSDFALRIFLQIEYPREFFNCQELLLDYSSCF